MSARRVKRGQSGSHARTFIAAEHSSQLRCAHGVPHISQQVPFDGARRGPWACTCGGSPTRHVCSICSVVRTPDRVADAGFACSARPVLHTVCRSFPKIPSALRAKVCGGSRSAKKAASPFRPAAWSAREIESQALATLAALAQFSKPSAAHFLKSHQLLVRKLRRIEIEKKPRLPFVLLRLAVEHHAGRRLAPALAFAC
jgi:hypothetical protein